ncbi:cell surface A33 antigen [Osmerus eperlanus]|uniref:cell surface A33 antigen n=1 Tax=Osmerus eperlanus TaxID=29151 RepID=UPI002E1198BA
MKKGKLTVRIFFILTVLSSTSGLQVSFPKAEYEVARGDDVTLTCTFQPASPLDSTQLVIITWTAEADNPADPKVTVATFYSNTALDVSPSYEGRATVTVDLAKKESALTLNRVTLQDNREFQCRVQIPRDDEGKLAAITSVLVLVAPSVPIVKMQGTAEYWNNISLTCVSEEGSPSPVYTWKTYDVKNIDRLFPPRTTEKNGVLSLFNISMDTSGFYICTATNKIRAASSNFTLTVLPPSMNIGSTAGIVGGVLAGVLVLGLVFYCIYKRKNKQKENVEKAPEAVALHDQPTMAVGQYQDGLPDEVKPNVEHVGRYVEERGERDVDLSLQTNATRIKLIDEADEDDEHGSNVGRKDEHRRDLYGGSRDRLDDQRERHGGSRDRLDDRKGGSRDRLDQSDRYSESRGYSGSRDRLDDNRRNGSRDRLDDQSDRYSESRGRSGSRDHLDNGRRYGGSRDRLDDQSDRYSESRGHGGSRDRLDDAGRRYGGSRDRLGDPRAV